MGIVALFITLIICVTVIAYKIIDALIENDKLLNYFLKRHEDKLQSRMSADSTADACNGISDILADGNINICDKED